MSLRVLLILLSLLAPCAQAACSRALRVPFEDWRPYSYLDLGGQPAGMDVELVQAMAREAGCTVAFQFDIPRKRRLLMFQRGELDLLLDASDTQERHSYAWFTRPYRDEEVVAFVLAQDGPGQQTRSLEAALLARMSIIVPTDGWYGDSYARLVGGFDSLGLVTRYEDYARAIQLITGGRGRVVIGDRFALLDAANQQGRSLLATLPFVVNSGPVHFMLSRRSLVQGDYLALDRAVGRLAERGVLGDIRNRYLDRLTSSR